MTDRTFARRVIVESPYKGTETGTEYDLGTTLHNLLYARACIRDCLNKGEAPFASHLLYTQPGILDDAIPEERQWGILAGLEWAVQAHVSAVYTDLGISPGMYQGIAHAERVGRPVEFRSLPGWTAKNV